MVYFHSLLVLVYTYTVLVWNVSYLSNHVNHLFIINQKITIIAISFKINMYVYTVIKSPLFYFPLLYSIEKLCFALARALRLVLL